VRTEVEITGNVFLVYLIDFLFVAMALLWRSGTKCCINVRNSSVSVDEVTVTERVLMFAGVGLAVFVFFLATILAGGIIYHRGHQKGWKAAKRASMMSHKSAK